MGSNLEGKEYFGKLQQSKLYHMLMSPKHYTETSKIH